MKKLIALLLIAAFAAAVPCFLSCDKPEKASLTEASTETREIVRTVLQKLNESYVDFWGFLYATPASSERIYEDACALVPEIRELDSRNDGALALLEEYESLLQAPDKGFYKISNAAHSPLWENPTQTCAILREIKEANQEANIREGAHK